MRFKKIIYGKISKGIKSMANYLKAGDILFEKPYTNDIILHFYKKKI